ncbi:DUF4239 domain-containing protein [Roseomonas sp. HF4]|uniref:bestrophin-like domain n=1 Tax=Roseomonas sp. HF4 TaxID=2562313 RepID=UPI0014858A86|nr:DUF4239 domain-containing protein [Roseomonas sp. HF4]
MDIVLPHILAGLPAWAGIIITIAVPVLLALLLGRVMYALFTHAEFQANAVVGAVKYGFVVEIYAVVAALTLVGSWDTFQTARDTLQKEASGLYMLALSVDTFDGPNLAATRQEMRAAIRNYAAAVVAQDWPAMQAGVTSSGSDAAFQRMTRAFLDAPSERSAQQVLQQKTGDWLGQVAEARIARLSVASRTLSGLIWLLVLTVSVAAIAFQWFFGGASAAMHYAMAAVIAIIVGAVLLVSVKLAFPYVGQPPLLSPAPFLAMMDLR